MYVYTHTKTIKESLMRETVLVLFGGMSVESDISVITGVQAANNLSNKFDSVFVYIDKTGKWWTAENLLDLKIYADFHKFAKKKKRVSFVVGESTLFVKKNKKFIPLKKIDSVLNCCHGNLGEDGAVQGYLKCCYVPQTSSLTTSSALCMDKSFMKDIFKANGINTPDCFILRPKDSIKSTLEFPVIVKPCNLGSSIGISVCHNKEEFKTAVALAFEFDNKILVEKLVENLKEFNCACFEYKGKMFLSSVCEVENKEEIYTFEDKYLSKNNKTKEAEQELAAKIKAITQKIYQLFDCQGVVRVDFLYDEKNSVLYANEINTIPGSLAFYLFKDTNFKDLLNCLIEQSKINYEKESHLIKSFDSEAIQVFASVKTIKK
ncbi:MAG: ATP-grasp domain-containing protein [Clostridiales bacterium]|nr:ATP-grasp domain-containing protein [Clostridiales bacterium]